MWRSSLIIVVITGVVIVVVVVRANGIASPIEAQQFLDAKRRALRHLRVRQSRLVLLRDCDATGARCLGPAASPVAQVHHVQPVLIQDCRFWIYFDSLF